MCELFNYFRSLNKIKLNLIDHILLYIIYTYIKGLNTSSYNLRGSKFRSEQHIK